MNRSRRAVLLGTLAALALGATACGSSASSSNPLGGGSSAAASGAGSTAGGGSGGTVVVGSANFPENVLLGSIYSQALKAKGVNVEEKFNIGSREVIYGQLQSGNLTVLPEYNGSLLAYLDAKNTAVTTQDVNAALAKALPSSLAVLDSSPAEDKDSLSVAQETADKYNLKSISDLAAKAGEFTIGGPPEFKSRREQQFKDVYGLTFKEWKPTADTTANALKDGSIQVGNVFTTDPKIVQYKLVALSDPKNVFGAQNITPLVNKAGLDATATAALNAVSAKLDTAGLTGLMKRVSVDKEDPSTVARDWLKANGLA
ncbi:ABC transporter substrate-binding protein [Kitasatospora aureofaciens]|nr:ABC transporter substrate-binding protein [Kitasatospora aureofaciens]ARF77815.1 glycine/betaine ABC transporter substrate-binding protein [Kitasatospora aureofaciens]OEV33960.1 glycine/betaine ABC transporter substrate-binding protein [Kitasatospora aureofaciens]QEU99002.1 ABC transporter substrate-binding protein [Streptomyces viridifaciens]UKZ05027.1 ABC transporter substrate-binding protein [Streptomyces viridifaciens]